MFKINRKIEYALISLKYINAKPQESLTRAKEICDVYQTPFDPTSRVLQIMAQKDVLDAEQGAKGGYRIKKPLNELTLLELSDMIVGPIEMAGCLHDEKSNCSIINTCHIISPILNLNDRLRDLFEDITVEDLLKSQHKDETKIREKTYFV